MNLQARFDRREFKSSRCILRTKTPCKILCSWWILSDPLTGRSSFRVNSERRTNINLPEALVQIIEFRQFDSELASRMYFSPSSKKHNIRSRVEVHASIAQGLQKLEKIALFRNRDSLEVIVLPASDLRGRRRHKDDSRVLTVPVVHHVCKI